MSDVLGGIPGVTSLSMFGGWGIYKNGAIFAIIADGELYFKVDEKTRGEYETRGSHPFVYSMKEKKEVTMSYWTLPEAIMENPEEVVEWVDAAVRVSKSVKAKKKR
jgi:DNA transformation protein